MKKIFLTLALILTLVFAFAACDSGNTDADDPPHVHVFDQKNVGDTYLKSKANENSPAEYYYSCKCGEKGTETFTFGGAIGDSGDGAHVFRSEWTSDDEKHWRACMDLSCDIRKSEANHTFGDWVIDENPTCMREGTKHHTCLVCGKSVYDTIPVNSTAHNYATTWTSDGTNHWHKCQNSGCTAVSDKTAHTFGEWIVDTAATCQKTGTRHHICTVCNKSVSESYSDANAHNYSTSWTSDHTDHWHKCQNSGCTSAKDKTTHTWDKENTCTICQRYKDAGVKFSKLSNGTYWVSDYTGSASEVIIPSTYNGTPVTDIGYGSFQECTSLTSISIPNSVTSIGGYAFYNCTSLTSISIPNSVTSIGGHAFYNCTSLTSITIPSSVTSIGDYAFYKTGYYNNSSNWENGVLYIGKHLIDAKTSLSGSYTIKEGTVCIGEDAFFDCCNLTSITISSSVTSIGSGAFHDCWRLKSITVPSSVASIGDSAFQECTSLTSITIPSSVTSIGDGAFYYCHRLTSITFGGTKAQWERISKGSYWADYTPTITVTCTDGTIVTD